MPALLIVLTLLVDILLIWLAASSFRLAGRIRTKQAKQQAYMLALVCTAFLVASLQRLGLQLVEADVLSEEMGRDLLRLIQLVLSVGALFLVIPALVILRRLTKAFAKAERVVTAVTEQALAEGPLDPSDLTPREIEVIELIADGVLPDEELAERLFISRSTAATHVKNILRKTGAKNRRELMVLAADPDTAL